MDDHLGILEKRIEAGAVRREASLLDGEGVRGEIQNQQKEDLNGGDDDRGVSEEALIGFVAEAENESIAGEEQRPEE